MPQKENLHENKNGLFGRNKKILYLSPRLEKRIVAKQN
jgi:hypothetical protein